MSRTVSALVTWDDTYLGTIGPVAVGVPWWVAVEPVVACLHEALGVPVLFRLPTAQGPARALSVAEPLAHLAYAVRYQEFLDGIEPSERIYRQGDPAASIRAALKAR
jgi:hypothetical protein